MMIAVFKINFNLPEYFFVMKLRILTILSVLSLVIFSCKSKSGATSTTEDVYTPGDAQLKAIQTKYADVTAATLKEGYDVYTGPCTNCHGKKNMYKHTEI